MKAENLDPTWIRSPDRPVRSESLYRLRYPGPEKLCVTNTMVTLVHLLALFCELISLLTAQLILYKISKSLRTNYGYAEDASYCGDQTSIYRQLNDVFST